MSTKIYAKYKRSVNKKFSGSDQYSLAFPTVTTLKNNVKIMSLITVKNQLLKPQDPLPSLLVYGVQDDGQTITRFNIQDYAKGAYLLLFFFPLGLKEDSEEVLEFAKVLKDFKELDCKVVGVTSESPLAIKRWMVKDHESGGFGQVLGFPIVSDKDLALSMSMGVARGCGVPARSAFIVDPRGLVRYCAAHKSGIKFSTRELLRLVNAIKVSDRTGMAVPAGWTSGEDDLIPTEYSAKLAYFKRKYGTKSINMKQLFGDFDRDGDGLITMEEIRLTMMDFGKEIPKAELSAIFEKVDKNKDQRIDFVEFEALIEQLETKFGKLKTSSTASTTGSNNKQNAFEDFDKDKDGLVSLDEIRLHLLETGKGISEIELQDLFNKADTNGDGKIDVTEFTKLVELLRDRDCSIDPALLKAFEQFDTDRDGLVSKEEVRSTLQASGKDLSDSELEICFNEADTNKDGKIDVTEFSDLVNKLKKAGKLRDMPR